MGVLRCWAVYGCGSYAHKTQPRFSFVMTRNDHLQDALPTQKLEWVTPKISPMEAGDTEGKALGNIEFYDPTSQINVGPS